jgi:hypothetical protein
LKQKHKFILSATHHSPFSSHWILRTALEVVEVEIGVAEAFRANLELLVLQVCGVFSSVVREVQKFPSVVKTREELCKEANALSSVVGGHIGY